MSTHFLAEIVCFTSKRQMLLRLLPVLNMEEDSYKEHGYQYLYLDMGTNDTNENQITEETSEE